METLWGMYRIFRSVSAQICAVSCACWLYAFQTHDLRILFGATIIFFVSAIVAETAGMFTLMDVICTGLFYTYMRLFSLHVHWSIQTVFMLMSTIFLFMGMLRGVRKEFPAQETSNTF